MQEAGPSALTESPSFTSYSSSRFADTAARAVEEFKIDEEYGDVFFSSSTTADVDHSNLNTVHEPNNHPVKDVYGEKGIEVEKGNNIVERVEEENGGVNRDDGEEDEDDDSDFEFVVVRREEDSSPISADEIFYNGQIRPMFPIFNTDLVYGNTDGQHDGVEKNSKPANPTTATIRLPLKKLLIEERETASCSSSEADDLESIPPGTYCVWTPKHKEMSKKSNSTGSSKRWRFRDLLQRSSSDGKDTFVFLSPADHHQDTGKKIQKEVEKRTSDKSKTSGTSASGGRKAHETHYLKNRAMKESDRKKSYLPYRQDLVGFFANVNGLSRSLQPF
ncbi:hypothetical protein Ancab_039077 [Ancistrocladus abbreviatus]